MPQIKLTIILDVPEGIVPDVQYSGDDEVPPEPPHLMAPLPTYDPDVRVAHVSQAAPGCPQHGAMTRFPAGVNKAGKPYNASWRCPVKDCPTKPIWDRDAA